MWSAFDEPEAQAILDSIDPAKRDAVVHDLRRTQGASWPEHASLGPALAVVALAWWEGVATAESVDRVPFASWLAILDSVTPGPATAAATVHGFVRLRDLSKVLGYQRVFPRFGAHLAGPMCSALAVLDSPVRVFVVRWVAENAAERAEDVLVSSAADLSGGIREAALAGLRRLGPRAIPRIAKHLESPHAEVRRGVVLLMEALKHPDALGPLRGARDREKSRPLTTAIQKAILACGGAVAAGASKPTKTAATAKPPTTRARTADLLAAIEAEAAPKLPRFVTELPRVRLRLRAGGELSQKATRWLLYRLTLEQHDFADPESRALRGEIVDDDCLALSDALSAAFAARGSRADDKWLVYQRSILGDEARVVAGVEDVDRLVSDNGFARATWTLDVLARHESPGALYWLEYFSRSARSAAMRDFASKLLKAVRTKLGPVEVQRRVDAGLPTFPFDDDGKWVIAPGKEVPREGRSRRLPTSKEGRVRRSRARGDRSLSTHGRASRSRARSGHVRSAAVEPRSVPNDLRPAPHRSRARARAPLRRRRLVQALSYAPEARRDDRRRPSIRVGVRRERTNRAPDSPA